MLFNNHCYRISIMSPIKFLLSVFHVTFLLLSSSLLPYSSVDGSVLRSSEQAVTTSQQEESVLERAIGKFRIHIKRRVRSRGTGGIGLNGNGSAKADISYSTALVCILGYLLLLGAFFV